MSIQLPLPAGWAWNFVSMPDPGERLDALKRAQLDTKAEIASCSTSLPIGSASKPAKSIPPSRASTTR